VSYNGFHVVCGKTKTAVD